MLTGPELLTSDHAGQATLRGLVTDQPVEPGPSAASSVPAGSQPIPTDDGSTVLEGQVLLGPTCPVVRPGTCADRPYAATLAIKTPDGSQEIAQLTADAQGLFSIVLDPGTYLLVPLSPPGRRLPFAASQEVTLDPGTQTSITIHYDSGIR